MGHYDSSYEFKPKAATLKILHTMIQYGSVTTVL